MSRVDSFARIFVVLPFDEKCTRLAAKIRADLSRLGTAIGPFNLLIAATALAHGLTLVTHNAAEFSRVTGLTLEDWELP